MNLPQRRHLSVIGKKVKPMDLDTRARERMAPTLVGAGVLCLSGWGQVVSTFSRAVNTRHNRGLLVSLIEEPGAMTTLSVCVPALFPKPKERLAPGDPVRFDGRRLVMEDLIVDLTGQPVWQGSLTRRDVKGLSASKVALVKENLLLKGRDGGFLGLLRGGEPEDPFAQKAMKVLRQPQRSRSLASGPMGLSGLVGLGPGSTPSGDDFISGVLLGEEALRHSLSREAKAVAGSQKTMVAWDVTKEDLPGAINRTSDAGKTLLWQALHGHFPAYLIETLRAISEAKGREEIMHAVATAVSRGATSGTDALTGFVYYMEGRL
jgi:hypothetical protein